MPDTRTSAARRPARPEPPRASPTPGSSATRRESLHRRLGRPPESRASSRASAARPPGRSGTPTWRPAHGSYCGDFPQPQNPVHRPRAGAARTPSRPVERLRHTGSAAAPAPRAPVRRLGEQQVPVPVLRARRGPGPITGALRQQRRRTPSGGGPPSGGGRQSTRRRRDPGAPAEAEAGRAAGVASLAALAACRGTARGARRPISSRAPTPAHPAGCSASTAAASGSARARYRQSSGSRSLRTSAWSLFAAALGRPDDPLGRRSGRPCIRARSPAAVAGRLQLPLVRPPGGAPRPQPVRLRAGRHPHDAAAMRVEDFRDATSVYGPLFTLVTLPARPDWRAGGDCGHEGAGRAVGASGSRRSSRAWRSPAASLRHRRRRSSRSTRWCSWTSWEGPTTTR